ncbi:MAG TPA: nuclear transport factor 2 family protein [Pyrinomonadaceae bacterium]|nr:nuclear transport factor 2 family protein [Pyrinomonadaceae bacterium]
MKSTYGFGIVLALALGLGLLALRGAGLPEPGEGSEAREVRAVLDAQAAAWNRGDIEGYMQGYEQSEQTTFLSGDELTRGWQTVLERYRRAYDTRDKMGTLAFTDIEVKPLSPFYTLAHGRWQLTRAADTPRGRFTLLFRRTDKGWRITHDHTSSAK